MRPSVSLSSLSSSAITLIGILSLPALLAFCKEPTSDEPTSASEAAQTEDGGGAGPNPSDPPVPPANPDDDVVDYAELCKTELGITQPLPAMSCLKGTEIPITVNGEALSATNYSSLDTSGCDNPQWLGSSCHNYDLIQQVDVGNPDVEAVLNCRQKYYVNHKHQDERLADYQAATTDAEKADAYRRLAEFNDLGFILRNKKTGKSCFFTVFGRRFNGAYLPPPDQRTIAPKATVLAALGPNLAPPPATVYPENEWHRDATAAWFTPRSTAGGGCVGCHDLGAFKHSPFVDQVDVVPSNRPSKRMPYLLVGNVFQNAFRSRQMVDVTTDPIDGQAQRCTSCHRMTAGGNTCNTFIDWSTGHDPSPRSSSAREWPNAAWMPLDHGIQTEAQFTANYGKHIERMKCCCQKPNAKGCKTRKFGPTTAEIGTPATGQLLPDFQPAADDETESCL